MRRTPEERIAALEARTLELRSKQAMKRWAAEDEYGGLCLRTIRQLRKLEKVRPMSEIRAAIAALEGTVPP